jgi:hypothetical protein
MAPNPLDAPPVRERDDSAVGLKSERCGPGSGGVVSLNRQRPAAEITDSSRTPRNSPHFRNAVRSGGTGRRLTFLRSEMAGALSPEPRPKRRRSNRAATVSETLRERPPLRRGRFASRACR